VVKIQSRPVASTAPTTGQVLAWNGTQWAPAAAAGAVTSVLGRTGAVTAQTNDYSFSQIGGTVATGQLPAAGGDLSGTLATTTVSGLQDKVLHDRGCMERMLLALSVNVSAMFRDPGFFCVFRDQVVPWLRTYPFIRIWCAGCSTGEEVYSLAILLHEEGLYDRCRIYATDMNEAVFCVMIRM